MTTTIVDALTCSWVLACPILYCTRPLLSILRNPGVEWPPRFQCASQSVLGGLHAEPLTKRCVGTALRAKNFSAQVQSLLIRRIKVNLPAAALAHEISSVADKQLRCRLAQLRLPLARTKCDPGNLG